MGKIKDLDKYLLYDNKHIIYNHDIPMTVSIPLYFKDRKYYGTNNESGNTMFLAICLIEIGKDSCTLVMPTLIETIPSETIEDDEYIKLIYNKGDIFFVNNYIVQVSVNLYDIFTSFITLGKPIPYLSYENFISIFDNIQILANKKLSKRVDFEFIIAEINRDKKDLNRRYRNSDMTEAPVTISMRNIAYGPNSVSAKIIGSYFNDGLVSSLLVEDDNKPANKIEALLKT